MRTFIVVSHDAPTSADFSLDDLPGNGRLDLLCRAVNAALLTSHGIRDDVSVHLVMQDQATVTFDGRSLGGLNPDERSIAGIIRKALLRLDGRGSLPNGVSARPDGLEAALGQEAGAVIRLHQDDEPAAERELPEEATFVLSDHRDLTVDEERLVDGLNDATLRLGPEPLHTDHAIAVAHNRLDRASAGSP